MFILFYRLWIIGIEVIDNFVGNVNIFGRWVYWFEDFNGDLNGDLKCEEWFGNDMKMELNFFFDLLDFCFCIGV